MMKDRTEAPGLLKVKRRDSIEYWWSAARASKLAGSKEFRPRTLRLRDEDPEKRAEQCRDMTAELLTWIAERDRPIDPAARFDGSIKSLNAIYETHPDSPIHAVTHATRMAYADDAKVLVNAVGERQVDFLTGADLRRWHKSFAAPAAPEGLPRLRRAQGAMKGLRRIVSWGVQMRLAGCASLRAILREARFPGPANREFAPSYEQVVAFIDEAHRRGHHAHAMGAALQFDCAMRLTDVIGKWEPAEGQGGYRYNKMRWTGGITWQDIQSGVLHKRTTKTGASMQFAIAKCPLLMAEIDRIPVERRIGPMVIQERIGRPFKHRWYLTIWRQIARAVGIPDEIWPRDTRAAAITEAFDAGGELEQVRQMATHSDPKVTGRYNRGSTVQTSNVALLRARHRAKERN